MKPTTLKTNLHWKYINLTLHCKYLRPNYNQIAAYGCTTTAIPWFQPLVVGCQSIFIVDIVSKKCIEYNTK
jgi:hypothetical protein